MSNHKTRIIDSNDTARLNQLEPNQFFHFAGEPTRVYLTVQRPKPSDIGFCEYVEIATGTLLRFYYPTSVRDDRPMPEVVKLTSNELTFNLSGV